MLLLGVTSAHAQGGVVAGGNFEICDFCGTLRGNTAFLTGRAGFGTERGTFTLVNPANAAADVDNRGYTPGGPDFLNLFVSDTTDFVNLSDPSLFLRRTNFVLADFLNPMRNGTSRNISFFVNVPAETPAGDYRGRVTIRDAVIPIGTNASGEAIRVDAFFIVVHVVGNTGFSLVNADAPVRLDSLTLRGRPSQTATGVLRVANLGNIDLANVNFSVTDLVATSGTGLRITSDRISFSPTVLTRVRQGDSTRVTVTVRIPAGLLAGPYRGDLIVQGTDVASQRIPITVIVTGAGDIVYETNPIRGRNGDLGVIIFNADPGTNWEMAIFDMLGVTTFKATGQVFSGTPATGNSLPVPGDQAVRFVWNLTNGIGENVAGGMYYVVVNATQDGKRRQMRSKLMVIR
ncbi:MAG: hypothetical protein M3081_21760 [Gemmatimonadota bacterium]|nr:hypothetical protein [Gemmatimonadota bacterium]